MSDLVCFGFQRCVSHRSCGKVGSVLNECDVALCNTFAYFMEQNISFPDQVYLSLHILESKVKTMKIEKTLFSEVAANSIDFYSSSV